VEAVPREVRPKNRHPSPDPITSVVAVLGNLEIQGVCKIVDLRISVTQGEWGEVEAALDQLQD
jgi:hypothetical protein